MDRPLRILVVDDSALMRQMVKRFLEEEGMQVVATARDGVDGLEKALQLRPDVITLDVEMPRMNGLDMLRRLLEVAPIPVVMLSSLTQQQAPATIEALAIGAVEVVGKPGGAISLNLAEVRDELVQKVRLAAGARPYVQRLTQENVSSPPTSSVAPPPKSAPTDAVVVIGSSTGGPGALLKVLSSIPANFPAPIVIVQHMPPGFTASLARRLNDHSPLSVHEAREGVVPKAGEAWLAPGGVHLVFDPKRTLRFSMTLPQHGVRPAVDPTLESAVAAWGKSVVAVILTGMGMDGARGARKVKQAGGWVVAQEASSCVVYGMPRAVIEMGLADRICGLDEMPGILRQMLERISMKQNPNDRSID